MRAVNFIDLSRQRFGRLTVESYAGQRKGKSYWNCVCDCGGQNPNYGGSLTKELTQSCGCLLDERRAEAHTIHGALKNGAETGTHMSWRCMMARCYYRNSNRYQHYGGRGIKVCERWHDFRNFLADMGERPPKMTIERRDTNADYCKDNCLWATQRAQQNNRRNNRKRSR